MDNVELAYGGLGAISNNASTTMPAMLLASSVAQRDFPISGIQDRLPGCATRKFGKTPSTVSLVMS